MSSFFNSKKKQFQTILLYLYFLYSLRSNNIANSTTKISQHRPEELNLIIIDNAGVHSLQQYDIPDNIKLIRIPTYSPELNPS